MTYQILITEELHKVGFERLDTMEDICYDVRTGLTEAALKRLIPAYDALIVHDKTGLDGRIIAAGTRLKVIGRVGDGVANVDIAAATRHGVLVTNTPYANSVATAEHAIALMLAAVRHTVQAHNALSAGLWSNPQFMGRELWCKTLGIVGFGHVGQLVAQRARAFGMNIVACDPDVTVSSAAQMDVTLLPLVELLMQSDIISLHTTVAPETTEIISAESLAAMKDGVIIVNVAHGSLIDEQALVDALRSGRVSTAALDVFRNEPPISNPLINLPNVIHTPHLGARSQEAERRVALEIVEQVVDALRAIDYRHVVNFTAVSDQLRIRCMDYNAGST